MGSTGKDRIEKGIKKIDRRVAGRGWCSVIDIKRLKPFYLLTRVILSIDSSRFICCLELFCLPTRVSKRAVNPEWETVIGHMIISYSTTISYVKPKFTPDPIQGLPISLPYFSTDTRRFGCKLISTFATKEKTIHYYPFQSPTTIVNQISLN